MIALQIPNNPYGAEMVFAAKIEDFLFALRRRAVCMPFGDGRCIVQTSFAALCISFALAVETGATDPKISTSLGDMADLFSVSQYPQFAPDLVVIFVHKHLLLPEAGRLKEMSRE